MVDAGWDDARREKSEIEVLAGSHRRLLDPLSVDNGR
jgi:hypothetical protein